LVFVASPL